MKKTLELCLVAAAIASPLLAASPADRAQVDVLHAAGILLPSSTVQFDLSARTDCVSGVAQPFTDVEITFTTDTECCDWEISSCGSDETDTYFSSLIGDNGVDYTGWDDVDVCERDCDTGNRGFDPDVLSPTYGDDNSTGGAILQCLPAGNYTLTVHFFNYDGASFDPATCEPLLADFPYEVCFDFRCATADAAELPAAFELAQNFPNPFNPTTTIDFSVAEAGAARLLVSNLAGETVATLVDGNVERGAHSVTFDASRLTSGVYFYTLENAGASRTRKMVLVK